MKRRVAGHHRAARLSVQRRRLLDLDPRAHPVEDPEKADAGRVEADIVEGSTRLPGTTSAPTMKNAAEEKSPGHREIARLKSFGRLTLTRRPGRRPLERQARALGLDPRPLLPPRGACARCDRVTGRARSPSSSPSARRPARRRQDFTCALATGISYSMPLSAAPRTSSGGRRSSRAETSAPISRNGLGDPVDRTAADGLVAVEAPRARGLAGKPPGQEAHQGPRVADVDLDRLRAGVLGRARPGRCPRLDVERSVRPRLDLEPARRAPRRRRGSSGCRPSRGSRRSASCRSPSPRGGRRGGRSTCRGAA